MRSDRRRALLPVATVVPVIACLALVTHRYAADQVATVKVAAERELLTVANLEVERLSTWQRERFANAVSLRNSVFVADALERWAAGASPRVSREMVTSWLRSLSTHYGYSRVAVALPDGRIVAEWPAPGAAALGPEERAAAAEAHRTRAPKLWRGTGPDASTLLHVLAPISSPGGGAPVGTLVFEAQAASAVATLSSWPVPRTSAAVAALAWDGSRWRPVASPSATTAPLDAKALDALLANMGHPQTIPGMKPALLAVAKAVPGSPWAVVVQIEEGEALALARARGFAAVLLVALVSAVLAVIAMRFSRAARSRELALRDELDGFRHQFVTVSELLNDALLLVDRDGQILDANDRAAQTYGYSSAELRSKTIHALRERPAAAETQARIDEVLAAGYSRFEAVHVRGDGRSFPVEICSRALRQHGGDRGGVFYSVIRDISDRRQAVTAMVSEQKFQAAFRSSGLGSAILDGDGVMLDVNRALEELLGLTHEEIVGRPMFDLSAAGEQGRARELFAQMRLGARDYYSDERTYRAAGGRTAHVVLRVSAIRGADGALQLALVLVEDVTEVKRLQSQLALADRMASVGTLAAGVAHEINNPLAFVLANIGYAEEEILHPEQDRDELRRALADAREGARRVRQIVLDLKTFAREDERGPTVTEVGEAIRFALSLVQNEVRHRARLEVRVAPRLPPVRVSEHRVGQVLVNLLVNAAHAIESGHASENFIRVTAARHAGGGVEIAVSDSGRGIAPELLPRIFEPFFTTKPVGGGNGLGLAVCHGIVSSVGGELRVDSSVGVGTTFHVVLPAASPDAAAVVGRRDAAAAAAVHARVLVIDDEPLVARSVARVLARCDVDAAQDGTAALARLAERRYDAVLCDLMMPDTSGPALFDTIRQRFPEAARRVVFLTGGAFTDDARLFLARAGQPVVYKPFEPEQLRQAVAGAMAA